MSLLRSLFHSQLIYAAVIDSGHIYAGLGIFAVNVERPIRLIYIIISGNPVDCLNIQAELAVLTLNDLQLAEGLD